MAPLLGLAENQLPARSVHPFWSVRDKSAIFDYPRWQALAAHDTDLKIGRFSPAYFAQHLSREELDHGQFVIIGGSAAVLNVERMLRQLGVHPRQVIDERLTL